MSRSRAYELIARNAWRSTRIGSTRRVDRESVERWIDQVLDRGDDG